MCVLSEIPKKTKVRDIVAFLHRKKYIPGILSSFSYGFYVPGQRRPVFEFQTMGELGVSSMMHLHFVVGLLGGGTSFLSDAIHGLQLISSTADNWEQCAHNPDGTLKEASDIEWINDPDDDASAAGPSGPVGSFFLGLFSSVNSS